MNLKKYTKAELISKINKYKEDRIERRSFFNKFKSYLSNFYDFLSKLKSIIAKLTLISFFLQLFIKYSIIKRIWKIFNSIIITIFSLSLIDNFGLGFLDDLLKEFRNVSSNIVDYLSNTRFYNYLEKLFTTKEDLKVEDRPSKTGSLIESNKTETIRNENKIGENKGNTKISEWLKPQIEAYEEVKPDETSYRKYLIIVAIIITSSLAWVYSDEIKTGFASIIEWIFSFRGGTSNDGGSNPDSNTTPTGVNFQSIDPSRSNSPTDIKLLEDKGKSRLLTSPSLEDLNQKAEDSWNEPTSPTTSTSSIETIKPSSKIEQVIESVDRHLPIEKDINIDPEKTTLTNINSNWKNFLKSDIKESIEYVEKHLPKSEIEDTTYIEKLIKDINEAHIKNLKEIKANKLKASEHIFSNEISKKLDNWIEEMIKELKKFE